MTSLPRAVFQYLPLEQVDDPSITAEGYPLTLCARPFITEFCVTLSDKGRSPVCLQSSPSLMVTTSTHGVVHANEGLDEALSLSRKTVSSGHASVDRTMGIGSGEFIIDPCSVEMEDVIGKVDCALVQGY